MEDLWIKETIGLIEDLQSRKIALQSKIGDINQEILELDRRIEGGEALLREYRDKYGKESLPILDVQPGHFGNKSYPEMLIEIAKMSDGLLYVSDAVDIMLRANVSKDKRAIQANIYSALRRMVGRFLKLAPGIYRYVNHTTKPTKASGVRQAVKQLKAKNPLMTKVDVLNTLIKDGFNFQGKQPRKAVHMAWINLGYAKQEKQHKLRVMTMAELLERRRGN